MDIATPPSSTISREVSEPALLARVFAGISEPTRLHIVLVLLDGERNVGELSALSAPRKAVCRCTCNACAGVALWRVSGGANTSTIVCVMSECRSS
jgi:hypothetical protein